MCQQYLDACLHERETGKKVMVRGNPVRFVFPTVGTAVFCYDFGNFCGVTVVIGILPEI